MKDEKLEKLLKLLDKYCEWRSFKFVDHNGALNWFEMLMDWKSEFLWDETIFSLRFGFIDWLFKNGYIDMQKCMDDEDFRTLMEHYDASDSALMVLATRYNNYVLLLDWLK